MRIALGIEYHGVGFCGWQSQPQGCGVQDHVEAALGAFIAAGDARVPVVCAGRTDTGVHAVAQVVHFDTSAMRDDVAWVRGVNAFLPPAIRITWACEVDSEFHARFSARSRTYRYLLVTDPVEPALMRGQVGWFHLPVAAAAMQAAAALLLGEHDFSAYRAAGCQAKSPVKTLYEAQVEQRGPLTVFTFRANAFLHHMVRNIVGELVYVGAGRRTLEEFAAVFAAGDRVRAAPTFAPDGLYLTAIEYDPAFVLPAVRDRLPF